MAAGGKGAVGGNGRAEAHHSYSGDGSHITCKNKEQNIDSGGEEIGERSEAYSL
jgi:hypothetical protein